MMIDLINLIILGKKKTIEYKDAAHLSTGLSTGDYLGHGLSISGNGNILAIGAYGVATVATGVGRVFIYKLNKSSNSYELHQVIESPIQALSENFGFKLALGKDGSVLLVTAYGSKADDKVNAVGAVYTYTMGDDGFYVQGDYLRGTVGNSTLGFPVGGTLEITADNSYFAAGIMYGYNGSMNTGAVAVYGRGADGKYSLKQKIVAPTPVQYGGFGSSIAFSGNAEYLSIGASSHSSGGYSHAGEVFVYKRNSSGTYVFLQNIASDRPLYSGGFGLSQAFNKDGSILVITEGNGKNISGGDENLGRLYIYELNSGGKYVVKQRLNGRGVGRGYGYSVKITPNAATIALGVIADGLPNLPARHGTVCTYRIDSNGIYNLADTLKAPAPVTDSYFGASLAMSEDGVLVVGAHALRGNTGEVYVFN